MKDTEAKVARPVATAAKSAAKYRPQLTGPEISEIARLLSAELEKDSEAGKQSDLVASLAKKFSLLLFKIDSDIAKPAYTVDPETLAKAEEESRQIRAEAGYKRFDSIDEAMENMAQTEIELAVVAKANRKEELTAEEEAVLEAYMVSQL